MAIRHLTELFGDADTFIGIPPYTGELTFELYTRVAGQTVAGVDGFTTYEWNTVTTNVTNLTEIGRNFDGIITNISGVGLDIPVALSSGIEAPATINGTQFEQFEVEDNQRGDWIRTANSFTPGSIIIEQGFSGFAVVLNNFRGFRQYYIDCKVEVIDGNGDPIPGQYLGEGGVRYIAGGQTALNILRGTYLFSPDGYISAGTSTSHYVQCQSALPARVRFTSRASIAYKQPVVAKNWLFILGQGQSLSVGGSSVNTDPSHFVPIRDRETFSTWAGSLPNQRAGSNGPNIRYKGIRPWEEAPEESTHIYSTLTQLDSVLPNDYRVLVDNNGQAGATIATIKGYAAGEWGDALQSINDGNCLNGFKSLTEKAAIIWDQGESDSDNNIYKTELREVQDGVITESEAKRTKISGAHMFIGQVGGAQAYWKPARQLWEYSKENSDAFLSCAKYAINHNFAADPVTDTVHLNKDGYDVQGAYHGAAISEVLFGSGEWRPFEPELAYIDPDDATIVHVRCHVPVMPIVKDTTRVPQMPGDGFSYRRVDTSTVNVLSTSISGNEIILNLASPAVLGDSIEIGNNSVNNLPGTNYHDSSTRVASIGGFNLYNDLVLSSVVIGEKPVTPSSVNSRKRRKTFSDINSELFEVVSQQVFSDPFGED